MSIVEIIDLLEIHKMDKVIVGLDFSLFIVVRLPWGLITMDTMCWRI